MEFNINQQKAIQSIKDNINETNVLDMSSELKGKLKLHENITIKNNILEFNINTWKTMISLKKSEQIAIENEILSLDIASVNAEQKYKALERKDFAISNLSFDIESDKKTERIKLNESNIYKIENNIAKLDVISETMPKSGKKSIKNNILTIDIDNETFRKRDTQIKIEADIIKFDLTFESLALRGRRRDDIKIDNTIPLTHISCVNKKTFENKIEANISSINVESKQKNKEGYAIKTKILSFDITAINTPLRKSNAIISIVNDAINLEINYVDVNKIEYNRKQYNNLMSMKIALGQNRELLKNYRSFSENICTEEIGAILKSFEHLREILEKQKKEKNQLKISINSHIAVFKEGVNSDFAKAIPNLFAKIEQKLDQIAKLKSIIEKQIQHLKESHLQFAKLNNECQDLHKRNKDLQNEIEQLNKGPKPEQKM